MYETSGNNAFQSSRTRERHSHKPAVIPFDRERKLELAARENAVHRKYDRKRNTSFLMYFAAISFCALVFTGILYRQAAIMEMNYRNVRLEREINRIQTETESVKEEFVRTVDLGSIRKMAIEELGMRKPASSQIVSVKIPAGDRVVIDTADSSLDAANDDLGLMFDNIEGFFKTMR